MYRTQLSPLRAALDKAESAESTGTTTLVSPDADAEETARIEEQLRQLGYL